MELIGLVVETLRQQDRGLILCVVGDIVLELDRDRDIDLGAIGLVRGVLKLSSQICDQILDVVQVVC